MNLTFASFLLVALQYFEQARVVAFSRQFSFRRWKQFQIWNTTNSNKNEMKYIYHQSQPEAFMEDTWQVHELLRGPWKQLMIPSLWNAFLQREPVSSPVGCCDRGDFGELLLLTSSVTTLSQAEEGRSLARSSFKSFISWGLEEWAKPAWDIKPVSRFAFDFLLLTTICLPL